MLSPSGYSAAARMNCARIFFFLLQDYLLLRDTTWHRRLYAVTRSHLSYQYKYVKLVLPTFLKNSDFKIDEIIICVFLMMDTLLAAEKIALFKFRNKYIKSSTT